MLHVAVVALGGNQGHSSEIFQLAAQALGLLPQTRLLKFSRTYETLAIGAQAGEGFLNAALLVETGLTAVELLQALQQIEDRLGRMRGVHWGPRTLDLDLIRFDDATTSFDLSTKEELPLSTCCHSPAASQTGCLLLPHPGSWYRRFVLDPWRDLEPDWIHPSTGESVEQMWRRSSKAEIQVLITGQNTELISQHYREHASKDRVLTRLVLSTSCDSDFRPEPDLTLYFDEDLASQLPAKSAPRRTVYLSPEAAGVRLGLEVLRSFLDKPQPT